MRAPPETGSAARAGIPGGAEGEFEAGCFNSNNAQSNPALQRHFDRAIALLERRAELQASVAAWRGGVRNDGLVPAAIYTLAREHLQDADQRRKAAEAAEVEELYRRGLGLPLFDDGGRDAE